MGDFEVHEDCIAAWARGDANKNWDQGGTQRPHQITIKNNIRGQIHIPQQKYRCSGEGGHRSGETNWGLQVSSESGIAARMMGDAAHGKINEGLKVHHKSITAG
jgi:hypothetical protein